MDIQRLRNLTTGKLHSDIKFVYEDLEWTIGDGIMTHMIPRVLDAIRPWLQDHVKDTRFWDGEFDTSHIGDYDLPQPAEEDRAAMLERYKAMPNPLEGKDVVVIRT